MLPSLEVTLAVDNAAAVLMLAGEADMASACTLIACLDAVRLDYDGPVLLDLSSLTFLDSSGINAIVKCRKALAESGRSLTLRRPTPTVMRVIEICGLTELLANEDRAVSS